MALDGITLHCLAHELNSSLQNQRIGKIAQPEKEELLFTFKIPGQTRRLLLSANASLPFACFTSENKPSPLTAPNFCMVLRKYIGNGKVLSVTQPGLERVLCFSIEHLNEMGDPGVKYLYVELMGKHSNIIFCDENNIIIDSIKHISAQMSSVREVLPGRTYFIPTQEGKENPLSVEKDSFLARVDSCPAPVYRAIYQSYTGISPLMAQEICYQAELDGDQSTASLDHTDLLRLYDAFHRLMGRLKNDDYQPVILYDQDVPLEFAPFPIGMYADKTQEVCASMSEALERYYAKKNRHTVMHQKSSDLRRHISTLLERTSKKLQLQLRQQEDTAKREKYRLYGELLHTYGYQIPAEAKNAQVTNYYDGSEITIPLDDTLSAMDNAKKYFDRYSKLKRTDEALQTQIRETKESLAHLQSIESSLNFAESEEDLDIIRDELAAYGYLKAKGGRKKNKMQKKSRPLHYVDANGFHIYVGKNNYQNDELTFRFASGNDWWFHAKGIPGSHVIVRSENRELPDDTYETAAAVAAYYSNGRDSEKVDVDYLQKKNVKKPNSAVPGFVIYHTNYSMTIHPSLSGVRPED